MMLTLYGVTKTRALRALWMLEELGVDYTHVPCAPHSDEIRNLSVLGKLPVLDVDGTTITDSTAILTFLADSHGRFTAPAGTVARGRQDAITQMVLDDLDAILWTAARHSFVLPEEHRVPAVKDSLKWEFARNVNLLMQRFEGPFLMGEDLTVPDFIAVHCGRWAKAAQFDTGSPAFEDYCSRVREREAFQAAAAL